MKKKKQTFTKKKIVSYVLITIILGTIAYYLGSAITKSVLDHQNRKDTDLQLNDLVELDSLENLKLIDFLSQFNTLLGDLNLDEYQIQQEKLQDNKITIHDIEFSFITSNDDITIVTINYKNETDLIKQLVMALIRANNSDIDEDSANLLFDKTKETLDDDTHFSQYFQYQGVETSLKKLDNAYQFRVGRITNS